MTVLQHADQIDWQGAESDAEGAPALDHILHDVRACVLRYVVLSPDQAIALALWTAHTHALDAADTTPYIHVTSATKRAGKTRLLEVLEPLVARPWLTGRTSAAALVRKVDAETATLLLDESDAAFGSEKEYAEALRGILNSGYKRSGKVSLCVGKGVNIGVRNFSTFGAKVIAGIGKLPDTVADRSIPVVLRRRLAKEPVQRWRDRDGREAAKPLHRRLAAWSRLTIEILRAARPSLPGELGDRAADVWEPLLAIADAAGGDWPGRARRAAVALMGSIEDADPAVELLADLRGLVATFTVDAVIPTKEIIDHLIGREDRPWATWRQHDKPITARGLAGLLGPLGIRPDRHLMGETRLRGYRREAFDDAFARYLPVHVSTCPEPNKDGPNWPDGCDLHDTERSASVPGFLPDSVGSGTHGHIDRRNTGRRG